MRVKLAVDIAPVHTLTELREFNLPRPGPVVGGELVDAKTMNEGRFDIIEERARQYLAVVSKCRAASVG